MAKIQRLSKRMDDLGAVNMRAIEDFEQVSEREKDLKGQIDTLTRERQGIIERMNSYEQLKKEAFGGDAYFEARGASEPRA